MNDGKQRYAECSPKVGSFIRAASLNRHGNSPLERAHSLRDGDTSHFSVESSPFSHCPSSKLCSRAEPYIVSAAASDRNGSRAMRSRALCARTITMYVLFGSANASRSNTAYTHESRMHGSNERISSVQQQLIRRRLFSLGQTVDVNGFVLNFFFRFLFYISHLSFYFIVRPCSFTKKK